MPRAREVRAESRCSTCPTTTTRRARRGWGCAGRRSPRRARRRPPRRPRTLPRWPRGPTRAVRLAGTLSRALPSNRNRAGGRRCAQPTDDAAHALFRRAVDGRRLEPELFEHFGFDVRLRRQAKTENTAGSLSMISTHSGARRPENVSAGSLSSGVGAELPPHHARQKGGIQVVAHALQHVLSGLLCPSACVCPSE